MELPEDVLKIIREYARPCFRYWKIFNHAKRIVQYSPNEPLYHDLQKIKNSLMGPNAEQVCKVLTTYLIDLEHVFVCEKLFKAARISIGVPRNQDIPPELIFKITDVIDLRRNAAIKESSQYIKLVKQLHN